jgi:hypothetical protein
VTDIRKSIAVTPEKFGSSRWPVMTIADSRTINGAWQR